MSPEPKGVTMTDHDDPSPHDEYDDCRRCGYATPVETLDSQRGYCNECYEDQCGNLGPPCWPAVIETKVVRLTAPELTSKEQT